jgi:hypothetical protein
VNVRASLSAVSLASDPLMPSRTLEADPLLAQRGRRHVRCAPDLAGHRRHDVGMAVPERGRREAAGEVDERVPVGVDQRRTRRVIDDERIASRGARPGALDGAHAVDDRAGPRPRVVDARHGSA